MSNKRETTGPGMDPVKTQSDFHVGLRHRSTREREELRLANVAAASAVDRREELSGKPDRHDDIMREIGRQMLAAKEKGQPVDDPEFHRSLVNNAIATVRSLHDKR